MHPASVGVMPRFAWLAFCQQCEIKKVFTDFDIREEWVRIHRRTYDHRVQSGAGKV